MGATSSKGSCQEGCLKGFGRRHKVRPDTSPGVSRRKYGEPIRTYEDAFKLERPGGSGRWSPKGFASPASPASWATPNPRRVASPTDPMDFDFELVIGEGASPSMQVPHRESFMDNDGPCRRQDTCSGSVRHHQSKFAAEQLFSSPGSLPGAMSREQRENVMQELMPTATHEMLSKIPRALLNKDTDDAQALRRKLCQGATMVFVCSGLRGKRFVLERAAALGINSVVLDQPDSWSRELVAEGVIAKFLPVDMSQSSEDVFKQSLALIKGIHEDGLLGRVDAITTVVELAVPLVARLCEALGLPGLGSEAVDNARDKHRTRACLAAAGLPTPRNFLIKNKEQIAEAAQKVGFPAVLKPVSGAASLGVKKVESEANLRASYLEIVEEMGTLVVTSGALVKGDSKSKSGVDANNVVDLTLLLEQYLDGTEVDVDVVMSEGEWQYACVSDNGPTLEPYFNETWAVCPSLLPKERQVALKKLAVDSVKSLGFAAGIFHVECKFTSTGPQLIEVNARMGGGQVRDCNLMTWGVDLVEETFFVALGIPCRPPVPKAPIKPVAYCYVNAKKSGLLSSIDGLKSLLGRDGVVWAKPLALPGSKVVGPEEGLPTWLCDLLVTRPTASEALKFLQQIEENLPVEVV